MNDSRLAFCIQVSLQHHVLLFDILVTLAVAPPTGPAGYCCPCVLRYLVAFVPAINVFWNLSCDNFCSSTAKLAVNSNGFYLFW